MNTIYVPILENSSGIAIYGSRFFIDLVECLNYINTVRKYIGSGEVLYYKTLRMYDF